MHLVTEPSHAIELTTTPIHLGLGSRALPVEALDGTPASSGPTASRSPATVRRAAS